MVKTARLISALAMMLAIVACEDKNNRVISEHVSPAGHVFQLMPITEKGVTDITISATWATDWFTEAENNEWVPGLTTEMILSAGTEELSPAEVLELLEDKNTRGIIYPSSDYIYAEVEFPDNHRNAVLPVLAELFQKPRFDNSWFDRIKQQAMDRINVADTTAAAQMWKGSRYALFGDGPQTALMNGTNIEALRNTTIESLENWYQHTFSHRPAVIVVTGAVNAKDAGSMIDELLPAPGEPSLTNMKMQDMTFGSRTIYLHLPDAAKSIIGFIGPLPDTTDGKDGIDLVALHLFAGGAGSPLFETIRTDLGASYGMGAELINYSRSQRALVISGEIDIEKMYEVRDAVRKIYDTFLNSPDTTLLSEVSTRLAESIRKQQVFVSSSATMIRELVLDGRDPHDYQTLADSVETINEEQLKNRLTTAFPTAESLAVFAAGPDPAAFPDACVITEPREAQECW